MNYYAVRLAEFPHGVVIGAPSAADAVLIAETASRRYGLRVSMVTDIQAIDLERAQEWFWGYNAAFGQTHGGVTGKGLYRGNIDLGIGLPTDIADTLRALR